MGATHLMYAFLLSFLPHISHSEIINCDTTRSALCGPCQRNEPLCNLNCASRTEICLEGILTCSANSDCIIDCDAMDYACLEAVINAASVSSLQLDCGSRYSCEAMTVNVANNADILINCGGTEISCKDLILNAQSAGHIVINCNGIQSCNGMSIIAAKDVTVNCNDESGNVCYGLTLICGYGQCSIDCRGPREKCLSITIDTTYAQKFECLGSIEVCYEYVHWIQTKMYNK